MFANGLQSVFFLLFLFMWVFIRNVLLQCSATISTAWYPFRSTGRYIVFLAVARSPKRLWGIFIAVQIREQITSVRNSLLLSVTAQPQRHETHWGEQRSAHREQHTVELWSPSCQCPDSTGRELSSSVVLPACCTSQCQLRSSTLSYATMPNVLLDWVAIYGHWQEQIWTCRQRCWLHFLSGSLFGNMIKVITLEWSCAFFYPSVAPHPPPCLPPAKTLAQGHVSPRFSLFYYFKRVRLTPFITEHCSCQSCNRVKLFRHLGIEQSPTRISKPDVIQGGIIPSCDSSLICDLDPICTHMYLWLIPSWVSHHRIQELAKSIFIH